MTEFWMLTWPIAGRTAQVARLAEATGWDGLLVTDTQCLAAEAFVQLSLCAAATTRIRLGTGVTNPVTRDVALMASGFNTLQQESGGRMSLGIGRGDSSLAHIGKKAAPLSALETFLVRLQRYLRGEVVDRDGFTSRLVTHSAEHPKVPVDIAGTGPRVIAMAARHAEGLTLGVGANPERIAAKVRETEAGLAAAGRARAGFTISAYVNAGVDDRIEVAREVVRGGVSVTARFSGMHGGAGSEGLASRERGAVLALADRYDMAHHGSSAAPHARALPDEFIDGFAAIGDVARVTDRLRAIAETGVDRIVLIAGSLGVDMDLIQRSVLALSTEVLPKLR
ncbi:MAG TPA: LLM class flavin-dependent oxidoreductase [Myxococcota bacterium]|nr:LLM class flavin-dependent oxidoreductase [Myxococcota bacterium]